MSAAVSVGPGVSLGLVTLRGRVEKRRKFGDHRFSLIALPAADEFSQPALVEVRGKDFAGEPGEAVTVRCRVLGFPHNFKARDESGEARQVYSARNVLEIVE